MRVNRLAAIPMTIVLGLGLAACEDGSGTASDDTDAGGSPAPGTETRACQQLDEQAVAGLLGAAPTQQSDDSVVHEDYKRNELKCTYTGGDHEVEMTIHRRDDVTQSRQDVAELRKQCPAAVALEATGLPSPTTTGFTCTGEDSVSLTAEWTLYVAHIEVDRQASPEELRTALSSLQDHVTLTSFTAT